MCFVWQGDDEIATIDSQTGLLTVNGAGKKITLEAVLSGNDNYNESTIEHVLYVKGKAWGEWISFPENTIEYILGKHQWNNRECSCWRKKLRIRAQFLIGSENGSYRLGLSIDSKSGVISFTDYSKVEWESIEASSNGIFRM